MSFVTFDTIYDEIFTVIESTLTTRQELINPYRITDNNSHFIKNGYAVEIGPVDTSDTFQREIRQFSRSINISLTGRDIASDKTTTTRKTVEKLLISDQGLLITALKNNISADLIEFVGDEGIEYVFDDREDIIRLRTNFIINYNQRVR